MNREDFKLLDNNIVYFDNGATTLKPKVVRDAINLYYDEYTANAHRGDYKLSAIVDNLYEGTRESVRKFINAKEKSEIVFTSGSTNGMNMIVFGFFKDYLKKGDEVLITLSEHASNIIPWFILQKESGIKVKYIDLDANNEVSIDNVKKAIEIIDSKYPNTHHYISTIGIKDSDFSWIKDNITLQLSIHSLRNEKRDWLIPFKNKMTMEELGQVRTKSNLKTTLNMTLVDKDDFDIVRLKELFDPEYFFIKLSPINPNPVSEKNSMGLGVIESINLR